MAGANRVDGGRPVGQAFQDPAEAIRAEADHGDAGGEGISGNDRIPVSRGRRGAGTGTLSSNDEAHFTDGDRSADVMSLEELDARVQGARFEKNSTGSGRHGEEDRRRGGEHHPTQAATRDERQPQRGSGHPAELRHGQTVDGSSGAHRDDSNYAVGSGMHVDDPTKPPFGRRKIVLLHDDEIVWLKVFDSRGPLLALVQMM
ncbi:UNVERIFIED_CONTAM: hypothetical protein PYX00_006911 [Menopon gallinae]|uniref:Uncharacterized protein n=1 Tax=Menopon gallinae TaxID=328185 RepID=A0AAW2HHL4_9NEOP